MGRGGGGGRKPSFVDDHFDRIIFARAFNIFNNNTMTFVRAERSKEIRKYVDSSNPRPSVYPARCGAPFDNTVDSIENKKPLTALPWDGARLSPRDVLKTRPSDTDFEA